MHDRNSPSEKIVQLDQNVYRLGPLGSPKVLSSYLIVDDKVALLDCGPSSVIAELTGLIKETGIAPEKIAYLLLTHIHLDHGGGAASFLRHFPNAKVLIPERGFKHMLDPTALNASSRPIIGEKIFEEWGACEPVPPDQALSIAPSTKIDLGHSEIEYIPAPGHAPHHHILRLHDSSLLFAADSIGIMDHETDALIPTTPPPSFDFEKAMQDISTVENISPRLDCIAHFQEVAPNASLFVRIRKAYETWFVRAKEFVSHNKLQSYNLVDCEELFTQLTVDFPEYSQLSADLREQAIRIDCAGMLNYCIRNLRP